LFTKKSFCNGFRILAAVPLEIVGRENVGRRSKSVNAGTAQSRFELVGSGVARFFSVKRTKTGEMYQRTITNTKWPQNILYGLKIDQMAIKCATSSAEKPSKIYQKLNFWFEKIPSGNPGRKRDLTRQHQHKMLVRRKMAAFAPIAELPDFSCYNISKRVGKIYQIHTNPKIYQMAIKYTKWP
jgi:hypothetical protein